MSDYAFILNPKAGRGASLRVLDPLKRELHSRGVDYDLLLTQNEGDAIRIAKEVGSRIVVAVGGDGTVNEVVNGIIGTGKTLGIIPAGSGNDLVKSIDISVNLSDAIEILLRGMTQPVDVGTVSCFGPERIGPRDGNHKERYFVNGIGAGFDAAVADKTRRIKYLSGTLLYLVAVLRTLGEYEAPDFEVSVDGCIQARKQLLIAVGNGRCAGGGFYLTPDAIIDDGFLDLCLIDEMSVPGVLRIMPKVMRGKHIGARGVSFLKGKMISIRAGQPFFVHADGEMVGRNVNTVEIGLLEKSLNVIVGDGIS